MDATKLALDDWLAIVLDGDWFPPDFVFYQFPTQAHFEEYIARIHEHDEPSVKMLLRRFLLPSGSLIIDTQRYQSLKWARKSDPTWYERMMAHSYFQRLSAHFEDDDSVQPWEGITWVLDLLPHWPKDALEALDAYFLAHAQIFPDGRLQGMSDAMAILRAWYIGSPGTHLERIEVVKELSPRNFEYLVFALYQHMGYACVLTPRQKDGGRDVIATRSEVGNAESIRVECKRWSPRVGVPYVRSLLGVVSSEKANKGVIVTTSTFTKVAQAFAAANPRIELVNGPGLITMLNTHLGTSWATRIDSIIAESRREAAENAA